MIIKILIAVIIAVILCFSVLYLYANNDRRTNYVKIFNLCMDRMKNYTAEELNDPSAKECISRGGCYDYCSGCGIPKPYIELNELFDYYARTTYTCAAVCRRQCLMPL